MKISKSAIKWSLVGLAVVIAVIVVLALVLGRRNTLPKGIASGNGRLEAKLVDAAAKEPLRVKEILVDEGALVTPGQEVVRLDTSTIESQLAQANAQVAAAEERLALAEATKRKEQSEVELADIEEKRARGLVADRAASQRELDIRQAKVKTSRASLAEAQATIQTAQREIEAARANAATITTRIDDATLKSPVTGRVLYRLTEVGEVLAPGGKALTLVNLDDVYMEIFLPSDEAARTTVGAEARITLDYDPVHSIAAFVSFVSPEAQFTPKQVETKSEREKLMFRVKLQVPKDVGSKYVERIKTGVRGVGYVKVDPSAQWPERLQHVVGGQQQARLDQ